MSGHCAKRTSRANGLYLREFEAGLGNFSDNLLGRIQCLFHKILAVEAFPGQSSNGIDHQTFANKREGRGNCDTRQESAIPLERSKYQSPQIHMHEITGLPQPAALTLGLAVANIDLAFNKQNGDLPGFGDITIEDRATNAHGRHRCLDDIVFTLAQTGNKSKSAFECADDNFSVGFIGIVDELIEEQAGRGAQGKLSPVFQDKFATAVLGDL